MSFLNVNTTNYLNPEHFEDLVSCFSLVVDYNKIKKTSDQGIPNAKDLEMVARIQYCCALRISEVLSLKPGDFDISNRILTLRDTKTGYKKCPKCKGKIDPANGFDKDNCNKCRGEGKIKRLQYTTIPNDLIPHLTWLATKTDMDKKLFNFNRQLVGTYYKRAGKFAQLRISEQQDERLIEGVWTHLLRKSRSKLMKKLGANRELRMLKLRHTGKDAHDRYDNEDLPSLIKWESENIPAILNKEVVKT